MFDGESMQKLHNLMIKSCILAQLIVLALNTELPIPVRFNPFKHHRNYIIGILEGASAQLISSLLDPVGNNYIDIYTGEMTPEEIGNQLIGVLKSNQAFHEDDFTRWLGSPDGYRMIRLDDLSEWIVRKSAEAERYIHIHPARTGSSTIRFKGSTLKTVYFLRANSTLFREVPSLEMVNRIRLEIGLSPVKNLDRNKGILKCLRSFFS